MHVCMLGTLSAHGHPRLAALYLGLSIPVRQLWTAGLLRRSSTTPTTLTTSLSLPASLLYAPPAVVDICRAAEEVFDHANHFDHLHTESDYFLGSDEDPELPRHRQLGRTISHASIGSDHGGVGGGGYMGSMGHLPR